MNFISITWLISCLADNIKNLGYYTFIKDYLIMYKNLKKHEYKYIEYDNTSLYDIEFVDNTMKFIKLDNVSYGDLNNLNEDDVIVQIKNLSYVFDIGKLYYIEAPN